MADLSPGTLRLLLALDEHFDQIFKAVQRLGNEAHMDDDHIASVLADHDAAPLEIISDTADEVVSKVSERIVEARLVIRAHIRGAK